MDGPLPDSLPKSVAPLLARARELASHDPVVSYWCKFKAAQLALDNIPADDAGRSYLGDLMDDLEAVRASVIDLFPTPEPCSNASKAALADNELVTDDTAGSAYVFKFASKVFDAADATDRAGKATRLTAKEFLAASVFFDVLSIFGPLETEVSEKITYAKWKATQIAKAFREGRVPTPGPSDSHLGGIVADSAATGSQDVGGTAAGDHDTTHAYHEDVQSQLAAGEGQTGDSQAGSSYELPSVPVTIGIEHGQDDGEDSDGTGDVLPQEPTDAGFLPRPPQGIPSRQPSPSMPPLQPPVIPDPFEQPAPFAPPAASSSLDLPPTPLKTAQRSQQTRQPPPIPPSVQASLPPPAVKVAQAVPASRNDSMQDYGDSDGGWKPAPTSIDPTTIANAQKHAKWAISALNYEDIDTAKKELRAALALIGG